MNNKAISVTDKPASFAAFVTIGRVPVTWPADLHHTLTELFHTAESEISQQPGEFSMKPLLFFTPDKKYLFFIPRFFHESYLTNLSPPFNGNNISLNLRHNHQEPPWYPKFIVCNSNIRCLFFNFFIFFKGTLSKTAVAVQAASALSSVSPTRKRKPQGIKPISVEQDKEDQIRMQLKTILDKIHVVFEKEVMQVISCSFAFFQHQLK